MKNDIFFINTPVELQEEIYDSIVQQVSEFGVDENKTIYLRFTNSFGLIGKKYFEVFITNGVVEHSSLNYSPDFLIFTK
jgi:hypothetical protein